MPRPSLNETRVSTLATHSIEFETRFSLPDLLLQIAAIFLAAATLFVAILQFRSVRVRTDPDVDGMGLDELEIATNQEAESMRCRSSQNKNLLSSSSPHQLNTQQLDKASITVYDEQSVESYMRGMIARRET